MDIHHPFVSEFPEHRETIRHLRLSDNRFRQMFEEYHQLDDAICRFEEEIEFATDQEMDELKFKRAKLKDALYTAVSRAVRVRSRWLGADRPLLAFQHLEADSKWRHGETEAVALLLVPGGPDAQVRASAAQDVEGRGGLGP